MTAATNKACLSESVLAEYEREQREQAEAMMAFYDDRRLRRMACWALSTVWLSVGGQTVFPVGLLAALAVLLPQLPAWSLPRRLAFTGRRALVLAAFALVGLFFVRARVGLLMPDGALVGLRFSLQLLPW